MIEHKILGSRIMSTGLIILISLFACGCSSLRSKPQTDKNKVLNMPQEMSASILYSDDVNIHMFRHGQDTSIGNNPSGYNSLDYWIGYSSKFGGVVFYRDFEDALRLLLVDVDERRLSGQDISGVGYDNLSPHELSVCDEGICQMRGYGSHAELWQYKVTGQWAIIHSWTLPAEIPFPKKWLASVSRRHSTSTFRTPSGYIVSASTGTDNTRILVKGDPAWKDPKDEVYSDAEVTPSISPNGKWVVIGEYAARKGSKVSVGVLPSGGGPVKEYCLWKPSDKEQFSSYMRPETVLRCQWLPGTSILASEVMPAFSGQSYIYLLDVQKGKSVRLPIMVERYQWCVVDQKTGNAP